MSSKIISARFKTKFQKTTIIHVYAQTNNADEYEKEDSIPSYRQLSTMCQNVVTGDLNAIDGLGRTGREREREREIGPNEIEAMDENGDYFC